MGGTWQCANQLVVATEVLDLTRSSATPIKAGGGTKPLTVTVKPSKKAK
jgi:hypothetical protein